MYEFEKKFRVLNITYEEAQNALVSICKAECATQSQSDEIFSLSNTPASWDEGSSFFRIRETSGQHALTLKTIGKDTNSFQEFETSISDPSAVRNMLQVLGYQPLVSFHKVRTTFSFDQFTVCLDFIEELGVFLEIEMVQKDSSFPDFSRIITLIKQSFSEATLIPESANYVMLALDAKQNKE